MCYGNLLHYSRYIWYYYVTFLTVLDEVEELLELVAEAMATCLALEGDWFFAFQVQGKGVHDAYRTVHFSLTFLTLNAAIRESVAVLRCT